MGNIVLNDVFRGRPNTVTINGDSSPIVSIDDVKDGIVRVTEEVKKSNYETVDSQELNSKNGRKATFEFEYDELVQADISAIEAADEIKIITTTGGTNSTGVTITMTSIEAGNIEAVIVDLKTKVTAIKTTVDSATLPYTIVANAAA